MLRVQHLTKVKQTVNTIVIFDKQFSETFSIIIKQTIQQVQSIELLDPHLNKPLATKITDSLHKLPHLNEATITNPTGVELPHLTSIHRLEIVGISPKCNDWEWMDDLEHLKMIELYIGNAHAKLENETNYLSKLVVRAKNATIIIDDSGTAKMVGKVLAYLPTNLRDEVSLKVGYR